MSKTKKVKQRTTKVRVSQNETWRVPRGFGTVYRRVLKDHFELLAAGERGKIDDEVIDLLALVGYAVTVDQVASWDLRRRVEAVVYAGTEHLRASDNPIPRYPRPSWLPKDPWRGPSGTPVGEITQ